ncbi:MAG TPA: alpha/beta hydrolase, partial [Micromonosporaceae bacterium]
LEFWAAVAPELARHGRVLAPDLPGFGRSLAPRAGLNLDNVAQALIDFCRDAGVKTCTVVAHSLGGLVGLKMAQKDPDLCRRLILVDGTPVRASRILRQPGRAFADLRLTFTLAAQFLAGLVPIRPWAGRLIARWRFTRVLALRMFVARPERLDPAITAAALSHTGGIVTTFRVFRQGRTVDLADLVGSVRGPVELVRGDQDRMNMAADFDEVRQRVPVSRELIVPECGHWPLIEAPDLLVDFILRGEPDLPSAPAPATIRTGEDES